MKPSTTLALTLALLVVSFIGARLYVGMALDTLKAEQTTKKAPVVVAPGVPSDRPPPPEPEISPGERARADVEDTFRQFSMFVELDPAEHDTHLAELKTALAALEASYADIPADERDDLLTVLDAVETTLPADRPAIREAFLTARTTLREDWGR